MSPSTSASNQPRTICIYLSATTADMQAERELLHAYVLPELNDRCREWNVEVALVDVRRDPALAAASPIELAAAALEKIDQCRPWFIGLFGDACDDGLEGVPEKMLVAYPWLREYAGESLLELELIYGVLMGPSDMQALVYLRDDRFLRDLPDEEKTAFSSDDLSVVERLESLKAKLADSSATVTKDYACRWDHENDGLTDLDELGKQMVEELYEAILQTVEPGATVSVMEDEAPAAGASTASIGSANESPHAGSEAAKIHEAAQADDAFDLDMEDVLDMDNPQLNASDTDTSAIEGVEPLDFLDDDDATDAQATPSAAALEPTIDMADISAQDDDHIEADDLIEDVADLVDDDGTDIENAVVMDVAKPAEAVEPTALAGDEPAQAPVPDETDENATARPNEDETVSAGESNTAETAADWDIAAAEQVEDLDDEFDIPLAEDVVVEHSAAGPAETTEDDNSQPAWNFDEGQAGAAAPRGSSSDVTVHDVDAPTSSSIKNRDEDDSNGNPLADELAIDVAAPAGTSSPVATSAPAVKSASLASKPPKKTSSLSIIAISVALLLLLAGGGVGGMYFAGMLSGTQPPPEAKNNPPKDGEDGLARAQRINEHEDALRTLILAAKGNSPTIDGDKLQEAQQYLQDLQDNEAEMLAEEPIQNLQAKVESLVADFRKQQKQDAEAQRHEKFLVQLNTVKATLNRGLLEAVAKLAKTKEERDLVAAVEAAIVEREVQQATAAAQAAAAAEKKKKDAALGAVVAALGDAAAYPLALSAYAEAFPEDPRSVDFLKAQQSEAAKMKAASQWNALLAEWSQTDIRKLAPAEAASRADEKAALLAAVTNLPGAAESQLATKAEMHLAALEAIAAREQAGKRLVDSLITTLGNPAVKASLVFGTTDGTRYYLTDLPKKQDDGYLATYIADLDGNTKEIVIPAADVDKAATGRVELAAMAKSVSDELAKIDEIGWESAFLNALAAAQNAAPSDAKFKPLDPVIRATWLAALMEVGSQGSLPLKTVVADAHAALAAGGVGADFNWADPQAAAMGAKCAASLEKLPKFATLKPAVDEKLQQLAPLSDLNQRIVCIGVLLRDREADRGWTISLNTPARLTSPLYVMQSSAEAAAAEVVPIGSAKDGEPKLSEGVQTNELVEGTTVYVFHSPLDQDTEIEVEAGEME